MCAPLPDEDRGAVRLNGWLEALPRPERPVAEKAVDEETRRALESLGYLESP